jgi:hypothetical protein
MVKGVRTHSTSRQGVCVDTVKTRPCHMHESKMWSGSTHCGREPGTHIDIRVTKVGDQRVLVEASVPGDRCALWKTLLELIPQWGQVRVGNNDLDRRRQSLWKRLHQTHLV